MRKILVVVGSGVENGNTDRLADAFVKGAQEAGHEVKKVFLDKGDLHGCRGCGFCQLQEPNVTKCAINDVMQEVYPIYEQCDTVVMASPLYFWTLSSQIKAFMDRLYAVSRKDIYPHKDSILLMTAGDDSPNTFEKPLAYYTFITEALGSKVLGTYTAGGCSGKPGHHTISEEHLQGAYEMGLNLK